MRALLAVVLFLLVAGCAPKYPDTANLNLHVASQQAALFAGGTAATMQGRDVRGYDEIIRYQIKNDPVVAIPNLNAPQIVVSERLAIGLREQGLVFEHSAPVQILLEINDLLATVNKPELLYKTEAVSRISVSVTNRGDTLIKRYRKQAERTSATRPDIEDLEDLLNDQLSQIINQILADVELRELMARRS